MSAFSENQAVTVRTAGRGSKEYTGRFLRVDRGGRGDWAVIAVAAPTAKDPAREVEVKARLSRVATA